MSVPYWILLAVAVQRLAEMALARRNTRALLASGGIEHGRRHYPLFVLLHGAWLATIALAIDPGAAIDWTMLVVFGALQVARLWVIVSLGRYWTTRVITVPGAALVRRGPYRFMRHPNYAIVAAEIALLPLAFGAWAVAAAFSLANLALLWHRVRVEDRALRRPGWAPSADRVRLGAAEGSCPCAGCFSRSSSCAARPRPPLRATARACAPTMPGATTMRSRSSCR
ncbi:MAG: hypothetical protein FJX56_01745 [Alphaproteobacteria bacterium]|nr:hypothetical protein [Alphaproteobacteria bacterium]